MKILLCVRCTPTQLMCLMQYMSASFINAKILYQYQLPQDNSYLVAICGSTYSDTLPDIPSTLCIDMVIYSRIEHSYLLLQVKAEINNCPFAELIIAHYILR